MKKKDCETPKQGSLTALRLVIAFIFLWQGIPKVTNFAAAKQLFVGMGFPGFLGPIVGIVEVGAAALIVIGLWNAWANMALAAIILVAIVAVQIPNGITPALQRDLLILVGTQVSAAFGPGLLAWKGKR